MSDAHPNASPGAWQNGTDAASYQFTVYMVRHGEPSHWGSPAQRYDIPPGPPLSASGRTQACMAANFLTTHPPSVIYTSPLDRALQTGQILSEQLNVPLLVDERIAEHRREETDVQVRERISAFWQERVTSTPPACIGLVSHGSPIRLMLSALGDVVTADPKRYRFDHGNIAPPAGIWRARCVTDAQGTCRWELELIFRTVAGQQNTIV